MTTYYGVYLEGEKLGLSRGEKPLAFFLVYADAVKFSEKMPDAEIKSISKSRLIELLQND